MKTEELKMILDMIATLGEHGREAFFWWLIMDKGLGFLGFVIAVVVFSIAVYSGFKYLNGENESKAWLEHLRDQMGVGVRGHVTRSEFNDMLEWVEKRK